MKRRLKFLNAFNSPFLRPKLSFYLGKTELGVPYFLPRKWVKATPEKAKKRALEEIENVRLYNERNANNGTTPRVARTYEEYYQEYLRYEFPEPKKIGFDFVPLGWKTKWDSYRHEWNPRISFVFFKWQIAVTMVPKHDSHYWESWLYYTRETKGATAERVAQCRKKAPQTWTSHSEGKKETTDYYNLILKKKWL
jgi:hypothetical protein